MLPKYTNSLATSPDNGASAEMNLIEKLRRGHEKAFCEVYDRYGAAFYAIILKIVKDKPLAEDLLQESFLKIWLHFPSYQEQKGRLFTWMLNIARNLAIDKTRSIAFKQRAFTHPIEQAYEVRGFMAEWMGLEALLPGLKAEEKILIELVYYQGYTGPEVAKQLNIPLGTVKTRLRAAVVTLRKYV